MRVAGLILGLAVLMGQAPAWAAGRISPPPLRLAPPVPPPLPAPAPIVTLPRSDLAAQCRQDCAQAYYFCLSSEAPEACPGTWSQCRAGCAETGRSRAGSAEPPRP